MQLAMITSREESWSQEDRHMISSICVSYILYIQRPTKSCMDMAGKCRKSCLENKGDRGEEGKRRRGREWRVLRASVTLCQPYMSTSDTKSKNAVCNMDGRATRLQPNSGAAVTQSYPLSTLLVTMMVVLNHCMSDLRLCV